MGSLFLPGRPAGPQSPPLVPLWPPAHEGEASLRSGPASAPCRRQNAVSSSSSSSPGRGDSPAKGSSVPQKLGENCTPIVMTVATTHCVLCQHGIKLVSKEVSVMRCSQQGRAWGIQGFLQDTVGHRRPEHQQVCARLLVYQVPASLVLWPHVLQPRPPLLPAFPAPASMNPVSYLSP